MLKQVILLAVISLLVSSCENDLTTINKVSSQKEVQVETGTGIELLYSSNAHMRAKLNAPEIKRYYTREPYSEFDKGVIVFFYDDSLRQISKLTANYGRVNEKDNQMLVRDNVEVINSKNEKLNCEELTWNDQTRKIYSDKFVKIQTKDEIIYGDGLEANEDLTNYKIKKIRGTINLKNNPANQP
jgi:LPS export ABC transporter protein LptC